MSRTFLTAGFAVFYLATVVATLLAASAADPSAEIRALTGARTRLVWVQHAGDGTDIFCKGDSLRLMGLDTDDGRGQRQIVAGESNFHKPLITPTGNQVVFSNVISQTVYVVNWDGTGLRELAHGIAAGLWRDPLTGHEWVYAQTGPESGKNFRNNPIRRYRLDDPRVNELVWDRTPANPDGFQISPDGRRVCSMFPWPRVGVATLPNEGLMDLGQGCCPSLAPDSGNFMFYLLGDHRHIMLHRLEGQAKWKVPIHTAPGVDGFEIYHPKWSNQMRFIALTGPYCGQGGITADVFIGRFDETFTGIEAWVRVTANSLGDFFPDVWVEPQPAPQVRLNLGGAAVLMRPQPTR